MSPSATSSSQNRQQRIVALARSSGRLDVLATAQLLQVSPETLRRDLRLLENRGLIRRTYGAILPTEVGRYETDMSTRETNDADEKIAIASGAVELIEGASTIFLDEGVLPRLISVQLPADRSLTVVTPSLPIASELAAAAIHEVIILGGRVRPKTLGTVDQWGIDMLNRLMVDLAFVGTNGVSIERGLTTPDPAVAAAKHAALNASRQTALVSEHTKFGVTSFVKFADVSDFDYIVTGTQLPLSTASRLSRLGPRVLRY
ncbi:DeoR/GlpR family DNA-binding transcription regulator [Agromyces sp. NPDC056965]|uniref:DeoR/GlpR family DNA-binding transcription regulator n=1 Tax=Agromyces sp. NPDC056965 TaxID=3345983 RepID=UPI00363A6733